MPKLAQAGVVLTLVGFAVMWFGVGQAISSAPVVGETQTRTMTDTTVKLHTKFVTVRVRGRVIRRVDHILVVKVPQVVFHTRTTPSRRIVVPAHVVRIREKHAPARPGPPIEAAVVGVAPPPVTITVPVTVDVPGPTTTVTGPTTTLPQVTTTVTIPTTITLPATSG